jgi:tRNA-2-methylthio-N6-dimethylallyladenosine synthase
VKVERLERLQAVQRRISGEIGAALVDHAVEVLVEGPSRSDPSRRFGRTPENRTVNFDGTAPAGARARIRITHGSPSALLGVEVDIVDLPPVPPLRSHTEAA